MPWAIAERKRKKKIRRREIPPSDSHLASFVPRMKVHLRQLPDVLGK